MSLALANNRNFTDTPMNVSEGETILAESKMLCFSCHFHPPFGAQDVEEKCTQDRT